MDLLIIKYDMYSSASTFHKLQWNIIDHKEQNKTYFWTYSFFTWIISFFGAIEKTSSYEIYGANWGLSINVLDKNSTKECMTKMRQMERMD